MQYTGYAHREDMRIMQAHLLYVDDEEDLRSLVKSQLSLAGYAVDTAADGDEAVEMLNRCQFDLVLLDIYMPGMNGLMVLQYIRDHGLCPHSIMLSEINDVAMAQRCALLGASACVSKPYDLGVLVRSISRVLAN